jgi:hypothetical protein
LEGKAYAQGEKSQQSFDQSEKPQQPSNQEIDCVDHLNPMDIDHMSVCGIEDHWRIVTIDFVSQINDTDELRGSKGELNNLLVPIP